MAFDDTLSAAVVETPLFAVQIRVIFETTDTLVDPCQTFKTTLKEQILRKAGFPPSFFVFDCNFIGVTFNGANNKNVYEATIRFTQTATAVLAGPQGLPGATGPQGPPGDLITGLTCTASEAVGDVVYISGPTTVARASAANDTKVAQGIIVAKASTTVCTMQREGVVTALAGLTVGVQYYLSVVDGALVTSVAAFVPPNIIQRIGYALAPTQLLLGVDPTYTQL